MESFSLLKYWKTAPVTATASATAAPPLLPLPTTTNSTTIVTAVTDSDSDTSDNDDDGPFFDLEFAVTPEDNNDNNEEDDNGDEEDENEERETELNEDEDEDEEEVEVEEERELEPNLTLSPSDDLFFKGRILRINAEQEIINSANKSVQFPIPVSLAKSATKLRVFMLGLKRSKSDSKQTPPPQNHRNSKKMFTVKFKVEEVPIFSLLSRASSNSNCNKQDQQQANSESCGDERKNKKEVVQKYLKMVKPLYIKVSKKQQRAATMAEKQQRLNLNLKKQLGKSKSAVVHSMVNNNNNNKTTSLSLSLSSKGRDDSLLQQQDGIQSAILHCKRSFNSSKDFLDGEEASSLLLTQLENERKTAAVAVAVAEEEGLNGVVAA